MTHTHPPPDDPAHMDYTVNVQTDGRPTPHDTAPLAGRINCAKCEEIEWHADAGHAWLRIPRPLFAESQVIPSRYSYYDDIFVYLEEDADAELFLDWYAAELPQFEVSTYGGIIAIHGQTIPTRHTDGNSLIRKLDPFPRQPHPFNKFKEARP